MPALSRIDYDLIKEVLDELRRKKHHIVRRVPIDYKNPKKGYLWPSISMTLIAKKCGVTAKTLYRHCKKDERIERLLHPFKKKTWNTENSKKNEPLKHGTKAWLESDNKRLKEENEKLRKNKTDLKIKNAQIDELKNTVKEQDETIENAQKSIKEAEEAKRELDRVRSENSRLRGKLMIKEGESP
ncbi:hypothetical protein ACFLRS_01135 [Campylobacterota bacterium]